MRLFNFSRIPLPGSDAFSAIAPQATHCTVLVDDFVYSIEVFEKPSAPDEVPKPLAASQIAQNLKAVAIDARKRRKAGEEPVALGVLTADERDNWTKVGFFNLFRGAYD